MPSSTILPSVGFESTDGPEPIRWPHGDYAMAAEKCARDRESIEILRRLCTDLETRVELSLGPGGLMRVAGVPTAALQPIEGRCWREVLKDGRLPRLAWIGLKNYGRVLQGSDMDSGTRRTGMVIHAVAIARLEALGEKESEPETLLRDFKERSELVAAPFVPRFVLAVLIKGANVA